jgi:hypothetical protein
MKRLLALLCFLCSMHMVIAQRPQLMIKSGDKGLYLDHSVAAKEGIYAIGRIYNVHPKAIAAYNNLDMTKGLSIGQVIHIPLTDTNFNQKTNKGTPLYYKVGEKEALIKVSNANNKVAMKSLREWNKLPSDNVAAGTNLIVGFLVLPGGTAPAIVARQDTKQINDPVVTPAQNSDTKSAQTMKKEEPPKQIKDEPKKTAQEEAVKQIITEEPSSPPVLARPDVIANVPSPQGYFKPSFDKQVRQTPISKSETVTSGVFRTSNGQQEGKFYLLIDGVQPGTIIRVINPENSRAIYAKVLGEMSGIRQNQGLNIRISSAAAATLGISDPEKFIVSIHY